MAGTFQDFQNIKIEPYTLIDQVSNTVIYVGVSNNGNNYNKSFLSDIISDMSDIFLSKF